MQFDEQAIELIKQNIQAEQEKTAELRRQNDLAEQSLKVAKESQELMRATLQAERNRLQLWLRISEQTAYIVQELPQLMYEVHTYKGTFEDMAALLEDTKLELGKRLGHLEYGMMLLLEGKNNNGNKGKSQALVKELDRSRKEQLLEESKRLLHELEVRSARYGKLDTPAHLTLQIEDLKQEIEELERTIKISDTR